VADAKSKLVLDKTVGCHTLELTPNTLQRSPGHNKEPNHHSGEVSTARLVSHGARYNIRGYFGALYTSLSRKTARREIARYFTVAPVDGFVEASIDSGLAG